MPCLLFRIPACELGQRLAHKAAWLKDYWNLFPEILEIGSTMGSIDNALTPGFRKIFCG
jgi:hypothetical protein